MTDAERAIRAIFDEAITLPAPERAALIERLTADPEVRAGVRRLLEHHARSGEFLSRSAAETFGSNPIGGQLAEFRIIRELGRGGMGVVYLAEDTVLKRTVALKALVALGGAEQAAIARFQKEAQAVARLSHPGIVKVHRFGEDRGVSFIAMEYIEGTTLRSWMEGRSPGGGATGVPAPVQRGSAGAERRRVHECAAVIAEVAQALDHAHQSGVIHRDVKPSNILVDGGNHAHLTDFGVARIDSERTVAGDKDIAGSFPYMSPEQARVHAEGVDHRSDVFSLGVVLYELLSHARPFEGDNPQQILRALEEGRPRSLRHRLPALPRDLATICHKAIERLPRDRYQTAAHMAADLRSFLAGDPILARPPGLLRKAKRGIAKHGKWIGLVVGVLVGLAALVLAMELRERRAADAARVSIVVMDGVLDARAAAMRWNPSAKKHGPVMQLGRLPLRDRRLEPGAYRFVVIDATGRFADFDDVVVPGRTLARAVRLVAASESPPDMVRFDGGVMPARFVDPVDGAPRNEGTPPLEPFWLDTAEVTNGEFKEYVDAAGAPPPEHWSQAQWESLADLPVVGVTRDQMQAYALWRGKRLPTVYEWLGAAQAPDGRTAPWASADAPPEARPTPEMLRSRESLTPDRLIPDYIAHCRPSRSCADSLRTAAGLQHVFGNVQEMTATTLIHPSHGPLALYAGGDWTSDPAAFSLVTITQYPLAAKSPRLGFRCARSAAIPSALTQPPRKGPTP